MSNVMNTPAEVIEAEYPIRVARQALRRGSGGAGAHRGGDGLHREYVMLADDMSLTSMFERAVVPPYGLQGGEPGARGRNRLERRDGATEELPGCATVRVESGDRLRVETPGGGGYGAPA